MSEDTRVKIVDIQVKYKDAVESMAKYRASIDEAREHMKSLKDELKDGRITQEQYNKQCEASRQFIKQQGDAINTLSRQVQNQIKTTKEQEGSLKQLRSTLSEATRKYDEMSRAERNSAQGKELQQHINQVTVELRAAENETMRFYRNVGEYPKTLDSNIQKIGAQFKNLVSQIGMVFLGGGLIGFGKKIAEVGVQFEDAMARVRAVTMAVGEDFKMMEDEAKRLGATTRYTQTEAANALENLTRNGLTAEQATTALSATLQLASAGALDLATSADIATNTMNAFGMKANDITHINDVLAYTAGHSATNVQMLGDAMANVAPIASVNNVSLEETTAMLGSLANVGIKGAEAGTQLRMAILGLSKPTANQKKAFQELGVTITEQDIKTKGLTASLQKLLDAGILKSDHSNTLIAQIFGAKTVTAAASILKNLEGADQLMKDIQADSDGVAKKMQEIQDATFGGKLAALNSAWEGFLNELFQSTESGFIEPIDVITKGLDFFRNNITAVIEVVKAGIAALTFTKLVSTAKASFTDIKNSAVTNAETATSTVNRLEQERLTTQQEVTAMQKQLETASATERERIEIQLSAKKRQLATQDAAIAKAQSTERVMWERAKAIETGTSWQAGYTMAKTAMVSFFSTAKTMVKGFILTAVIMLAYEAFVKLSDMLDFTGGKTEGLMTKVGKFVKEGLQTLINWLQKGVDWFVKMYNESMAFAGALQSVKAIFLLVWDVFKAGIKGIWNNFKALGKEVMAIGKILASIFTLDWDGFKQGIKDFGNALGDLAKDQINVLKDLGKNATETIGNAIKGARSQIKPIQIPVKVKSGDGGKGGQTSTIVPTDTDTDTAVGGGGGLSDKEKKAQEKRQRELKKAKEEEIKLVDQAEKALIALMGESIEAKRKQTEQHYDSEIRKLRTKLDTDKTLTATAQEAINTTIIALEQKKAIDLAKLDDEEIKRTVQETQKRIDAELSIIKQGSEEELALRKEKIDARTQLELLTLKEEQEKALQNVGDNLERRAEVEADYIMRRSAIMEQSRRDIEQAEIDHQNFLHEQRQLFLQNRLTELEIHQENEMELQESLNELNLDVVTQGEMAILDKQREMAEEHYQFILRQGQLETETIEEFEARKLAAKQKQVEAENKLKQASLKNEKAYSASMQNITGSLISLTDELGESNEGFAQFSKMLTLAQIAIDTGRAISAGVASASALPFPANLAAIATTIATVMANITTAISTVNSAKFATGGKVTGPGTGTSDSIPAYLSNGEFVMTAKATKIFEPMLMAMNSIGSGVPMQVSSSYERTGSVSMMDASFAEAVKEIRPVVSVEEITDTQNRVEVIQNLDTL